MLKVKILMGIPASGKSHYIANHKKDEDIVIDNFYYQKVFDVIRANYLMCADIESALMQNRKRDMTVYVEGCFYRSYRRKILLFFIKEYCKANNIEVKADLIWINPSLEQYTENMRKRYENSKELNLVERSYNAQTSDIEDPRNADKDYGFDNIEVISDCGGFVEEYDEELEDIIEQDRQNENSEIYTCPVCGRKYRSKGFSIPPVCENCKESE